MNTGCVDKARDSPSQNACDDTFSTIEKGPRKRGRASLRGKWFGCSVHLADSVPDFDGGIGRHAHAGVDTRTVSDGMEILGRKGTMELLENL